MSQVVEFNKYVEAGDLEPVAQFIENDPELIHTFTLQRRDWGEEMWLPLHRAAFHGHPLLVKLLLQHGARPDSRTRFRTPFHARCTAMHFAAAGGYTDILQMLVDAGGDLDVINTQNESPLHLAARYGRPKATEMLCAHHARVDMRDQDDRTPLHLAILGDHAEISGGRPDDVMPVLLAHGADVNAACPKEPLAYTPLHRCVSVGTARLDCARLLVEAGADLGLADLRDQRTAVELAQFHLKQGNADMQAYVDLLG